MSFEDRFQIHELVSLYGHIADECEYHRVPELFAEDAVFDATDVGLPLAEGLSAIRALWETSQENPLGHHATNVVVTRLVGDTAEVVSKGIGVGYQGRVGSVVYHDIMKRTVDGWRIAHRRARLRRPENARRPAR